MGGVNQSLLQQLAPPHAPPPAGWWPPAPGWWLLVLLPLIAAALTALWLRRPRRRLRGVALDELRRLERETDAAVLARGLEHLLRRYAISRFGRAAVAPLAGERWLQFLAAHGGAELAGEPGRALLRAAYGGTAGGETETWLRGARGFLRARR